VADSKRGVVAGLGRVVFLAVPPVQILDVTGPFEVFARSGYPIALASLAGGMVSSSSGLDLGPAIALTDLPGPIDTLIVPGGEGAEGRGLDPRIAQWLGTEAPSIRRVAAVCTGAFCLGAAGLLRGKRAVTHWQWCVELQNRFPDVQVESDHIFVRDGAVYTSAGVTAGIDLALALVEEDLGSEAALSVARDLVLYLRRQGGQSQYSTLLQAQAGGTRDFAALRTWMMDHLSEHLPVRRLAERAHMSPRHFSRAFAMAMRQTPAQFVEALRIEVARREIERGRRSLKETAAVCGFGSEDVLRRAFQRRLGINPRDYATRFGLRAAAPSSLEPASAG
jgi:transcriptional regulator GlxA family with amidase domain